MENEHNITQEILLLLAYDKLINNTQDNIVLNKINPEMSEYPVRIKLDYQLYVEEIQRLDDTVSKYTKEAIRYKEIIDSIRKVFSDKTSKCNILSIELSPVFMEPNEFKPKRNVFVKYFITKD